MRLLIVEDERELAESLRRGLTSEGYNVDVVQVGSAGLEFAMTEGYQAVILELMPKYACTCTVRPAKLAA